MSGLTYGQFLLIFVITPIIILFLSIISGSKANKTEILWVGLIALIAFVWTPIWDNYLVANKIWWYDNNLVWNIIIGYVPLEEYCFFVLQPLLGGLYLMYVVHKQNFEFNKVTFNINNGIAQFLSILLVILIWMSSVYYFTNLSAKDEYVQWTYLMLIIIWSFPPLLVQLAFAGDILFYHGKLLAFVIMSATLYLSLADCLAIHVGIWTIAEDKSLGNIGPILPFEEAFFFFITNVLCVFGCSFYLLPESRQRMRRIIAYFTRLNTGKKYE